MQYTTISGECVLFNKDVTLTPLFIHSKGLTLNESNSFAGPNLVSFLRFNECPLSCNKPCTLKDRVTPLLEMIDGRGDSICPIEIKNNIEC